MHAINVPPPLSYTPSLEVFHVLQGMHFHTESVTVTAQSCLLKVDTTHDQLNAPSPMSYVQSHAALLPVYTVVRYCQKYPGYVACRAYGE